MTEDRIYLSFDGGPWEMAPLDKVEWQDRPGTCSIEMWRAGIVRAAFYRDGILLGWTRIPTDVRVGYHLFCSFDLERTLDAPPLREPVAGLPQVKRGEKVLVVSDFGDQRVAPAIVLDSVVTMGGKPVVIVEDVSRQIRGAPVVEAVTNPAKRLARQIA